MKNSSEGFFSSNDRVPDNIRNEIATEGEILSERSIDFFIDIVKEQLPKFNMFYAWTYQLIEYYKPIDTNVTDDVQILYGGEVAVNAIGHWICINYKTVTRKLYVYDSKLKNALDSTQQNIIRILYPAMEGDVIFVEPKSVQTDNTSCGLFTIAYATSSLIDEDPAKLKLKLNNIRGDQSLYLRLYILKMFANRKLTLFK